MSKPSSNHIENTKAGYYSHGKPTNKRPAMVQPNLLLFQGIGIKLNQPLTDVELSEVMKYTKSVGYVELNDYSRKEKEENPELDQ